MKQLRITFLLLLLFLFGYVSNAQTTSKKFIDTTSIFCCDWKSVYIGYSEEEIPQDTTTLPDSIVQIDTISKTSFLKFVNLYRPQINMDTAVITSTDSSFTLRTKNFQKTFPAYRICECTASTYLGFLTPLNVYIVNTVDMHNEIAYTQLIDQRTGKMFEVPTCSDPGPEAILISPKNKTVLTYSTSEYEQVYSCIYLLMIDNTSKQAYRLRPDFSIHLKGMFIQQLVWVNEQSFVLEFSTPSDTETGEAQRTSSFLKVTIGSH